MESSPGIEAKEKVAPSQQMASQQTGGVISLGMKESIWKVLQGEPHRAYATQDLVRILKLQSPKDPQKQAQAVQEIGSNLRMLVEEGRATEVAPDLFKARLFFDKEERIEHAYIGGMGNTSYHFRSPIFRLNLGVLSLYFIKDKKEGNWLVTVKDTTIGKDYCLARRFQDGTCLFGSHPREAGEERYWQIEGKYIAKKHVTLVIAGEEIGVEDHNTLNGTRIDFLTKEGLARYRQAALTFLQGTDPQYYNDIIKRGRFALEQLLHHHQNFETTFFSAVVDSLLLEGLQKALKGG